MKIFRGGKVKQLILGLLLCFSLVETVHAEKSTSIFPKNDKWIGVGFLDDGISQATFNDVLAKIINIYNPIVASHGFKLQFNLLWDDGTVNSDTDTEGDTWVINSYGGLARYNGMTADGYAAVACHELGHHLGGSPLFSDGSDMSVEGEADYHVGKCLVKYFADDDNIALMKAATIDPLVLSECSAAFVGNATSIAICERIAISGYVVANILRDLDGSPAIAYNTPDTSQVNQTNEDHPAAQCRLDTYFNSSVCPAVASDVEFSNTDPAVGACMSGPGIRPRCWFQPDAPPPPTRRH